MTDDNLDDVQPKKIILECSEKELRLIWNAAIEAAANEAVSVRLIGVHFVAEQIRKLKK